MRMIIAYIVTGVLVLGTGFHIGKAFQARRDAMELQQAIRALDEAVIAAQQALADVEKAQSYAAAFQDRCIAAFETKNIYHEKPVMTLARALAGHGFKPAEIRTLVCGR